MFGQSAGGQGWLLPAPGLEKLPEVPLAEPTRRQRLQWETDYYEFTASGHPLRCICTRASVRQAPPTQYSGLPAQAANQA